MWERQDHRLHRSRLVPKMAISGGNGGNRSSGANGGNIFVAILVYQTIVRIDIIREKYVNLNHDFVVGF